MVDTGSKVSAMTVRLILVVKARTFSASKGPKTSSAWKPGNTIMPNAYGNVESYHLVSIRPLKECHQSLIAYLSHFGRAKHSLSRAGMKVS